MIQTIGPYQIQRVLGTGGMATVYAAMQDQPRRLVAIKVMRDLPDADRAVRRFRREIDIVGRLRHPYIAQVYHAGVHEDEDGRRAPYYVMEYVPGARTIIDDARERDLSLRERIKLLVKVCAAVEHGHRKRIIHRDLKPGNILVDEEGAPKVIDFGVARTRTVTGESTSDDGRLVGTIQYMAPEQLGRGATDLDTRCDVYALGIILYRLIAGRRPFDLEGLPVTAAAHIITSDDPDPVSQHCAEARGDLEAIVTKALARNRDERYRSAGALGRDLMRYLKDEPVSARKSGHVHRTRLLLRRRRPAVLAVGITLAIVVAGAAIVIALNAAQSDERETVASAPETEAREQAPGTEENAASPPDAGISRELIVLERVNEPVVSMLLDPARLRLATITPEPSIKVWDLAGQQVIAHARDHDLAASDLRFSADGTRLASLAPDGAIVVIDPANGDLVARLSHSFGTLGGMDLSTDGTRLAVSCPDLVARVLDFDGNELSAFRSTRGALSDLRFTADGDAVVVGTERGDVVMWDAESGAIIRSYRGDGEPVDSVRVTDTAIVALHADGSALRWTREGGAFSPIEPITGRTTTATHGTWQLTETETEFLIRDLAQPFIVYAPLEIGALSRGATMHIDDDGSWIALATTNVGLRVVPIEPRIADG